MCGGSYFLPNIQSVFFLISLSLVCHNLGVNLECTVRTRIALYLLLHCVWCTIFGCELVYLVWVQYQIVLQYRHLTQPFKDQTKFGFQSCTLLVPCLVITKTSSEVRTASYAWLDVPCRGWGAGNLKISVISFQNLQIYSERIINFQLESVLSTADQFPHY